MKSADGSGLDVDQNSPWLGLASFTEDSRPFFFGREEEVAELLRRVQRKLLTILFGKSGLGKTSILQAGLVPALRVEGYFPVYIRIDYGHQSPEASEQIKQAINRAAAAGQWSQAEVAVPGESVWEFLHHRDDALRGPSGEKLIPLLIFDQFEELFTLAQSDEFGRIRAARFVEELADLVENRAPKALEAKLEADESAAERFEFSRYDYRVVIALREDYLAPLESLKKQMPSLTQNRLRLAPMTGLQALEAVLLPGGQLVSEEVAAAIVRFVAGGSELSNAEVEPSLLSLICRELNEQRIAQNRPEISLDLLAGSHASILSSFYDRAVADQPAAVRRFIEDELLTESGYRENLAEEGVLRRLTLAGADPEALAVLVNRRLLRIEERLDVRRVELTHDVLTGVVKASRDQRLEREAREATERLLAEQRAREQAARVALRRARAIAAGCTILAAVAIVAAGLAIVNVQRARRAEEDARQTRMISEQARGQAEGLLSFLSDDFVNELETFGRYKTIAELSQKEIEYFRTLPAALKDPQTVRNGALALVSHATAAGVLQDLDTANKNASEAIVLLEQQRRDGDRSEANTIVLARASTERGALLAVQGDSKGYTDTREAVDLLSPIVARAGSPPEAARAYLWALFQVANLAHTFGNDEEARKAASDAISMANRLGAHRHGAVTVEADYVAAGGVLSAALVNLGRNDEARRAAKDALELAEEVLAQRPQDTVALGGKFAAEGSLAEIAGAELNPTESLHWATREQQTALAALNLEPKNRVYLIDLNNAYSAIAAATWAAGQVHESIRASRQAMELTIRAISGGEVVVAGVSWSMTETAYKQAQIGDAAGVAATAAVADNFIGPGKLREMGLSGRYAELATNALRSYPAAVLAYMRGDSVEARRITHDALAKLQSTPAQGGSQVAMRMSSLCLPSDLEGHAEYSLGDFAAAAQAERTALQPCEFARGKRYSTQVAIWLSMALAGEGKLTEAALIINPIVTMYRGLASKNRGDQLLPVELAGALYAQSLIDERARPALLHEAAGYIDAVAPNIAALYDTRQWRSRIHNAQH